MNKLFPLLCLGACVGLSACDSMADEADALMGDIVITEGVAVPTPTRTARPALSSAAAVANIGGSSANAVSLKPATCDEGSSQQVTVTYTISGRQGQNASFKVYPTWTYNGSWVGSGTPTTVSVPARESQDALTILSVNVTVVNGGATSSGTSNFTVKPFDLVTSAPATLNVDGGNVTVNVAFNACPVTNTAPSLIVPAVTFTVEASSASGAAADFAASVTAGDIEDGDLLPTCSPASGSTFPLGTTEVTCSVTDSGGLTTSDSFEVEVVDTTPAAFTIFPSGLVKLIAAGKDGAVLDVSSLGIAAADAGGVSEPSTFSCDYVAGTKLGIGSTTQVSCTASDALGNGGAPRSFDVFVGLNVTAPGFLSPLRMTAPFSMHKRGSTVPHKLIAPTYADGTPATDLAAGLSLVVKKLDGSIDPTSVDGSDFSAGSTTWRYEDGQYIFNLKTTTASPWSEGTWQTTVSFAGITLAQTKFDVKK